MSPLEVDRYLYDGNADFEYFPSMFPAPPEVDRELYVVLVGRLTRDAEFPSPLEVDRWIYMEAKGLKYTGVWFPPPYEVTTPSLSLGCDSLMFLITANLAISLQKYEI